MQSNDFTASLHAIATQMGFEIEGEHVMLPYVSTMYGSRDFNDCAPGFDKHRLHNVHSINIEDEEKDQSAAVRWWEPHVPLDFGNLEEREAEVARCRYIEIDWSAEDDSDEMFAGTSFADAITAINHFFGLKSGKKKAKAAVEEPQMIYRFDEFDYCKSLKFLVIGEVRVPLTLVDKQWFVADVGLFRAALGMHEPVIGEFKVFASALSAAVTNFNHSLSDINLEVVNNGLVNSNKRSQLVTILSIGPLGNNQALFYVSLDLNELTEELDEFEE